MKDVLDKKNENLKKTVTQENIEKIDYWLKEISKTNDMSLKITDDLRMILLNLKIVTAWLDKTIGIDPVIDDLERIIIASHKGVLEMITNGRKELHDSWSEVKEKLLEEEKPIEEKKPKGEVLWGVTMT